MAVFVCKRCAGALSYIKGSAACKCEYCGAVQSLPRFDDEQLAVLYERAAYYLKNGEYSMALALYERILTAENADADVFWSAALCRYGVEFVDGAEMPLVNLTRHSAFREDKDYISALRFALPEQKEIFEREAALIDAVRSENIAISQKEPPYDIYISCLEADESGRRTVDSTLAADIHKLLTNAGYRVFFPRISLAENTSAYYEPYVFAALNSAAVMIVLGTRAEHFSNTWVRSEWERYLALISGGAAKTIFPAVKDVDPYTLPQELSGFQALDMSRLGFSQDLLAAVERLVRPHAGEHTEQQISVSGDDIGALLDRVYRLLERRSFAEADKLCDSMLDIRPEDPRIYLAKLLAELNLTNEGQFMLLRQDISQMGSYIKAVRFGTPDLISKLSEYRALAAYNYYSDMLRDAKDEEQCNAAKEGFLSLGGYLYSPEMADKAAKLAKELPLLREQRQKEKHYAYAVDIISSNASVHELQAAGELLRTLGDYKDSQALAEQCDSAAAELNRALAHSSKAARSQQLEREREHKKRTLRTVFFSVGAAVIVLAAVLIPITVSWAKVSKTYSEAVAAREEGDYELAERLFTELGDHADSGEQLLLTRYQRAEAAALNGSYDEAIAVYSELGAYSDSAERISAVKYRYAEELREKGDFKRAISLFSELGAYLDSEEQLRLTRYTQALSLRESGEFDNAAALLASLGDYYDAQEQLLLTEYSKAVALQHSGEYEEAIKTFEKLGDYSDSKQHINESVYSLALEIRQEGEFKEAVELLEQLGDYSDAEELLLETKYDHALLLVENKSYSSAIEIFEALGSYSDSADKVLSSKYEYAVYLNKQGYHDKAISLFNDLGDYADSAELAEKAAREKSADPYPGDVITFGNYEQDGILSNGKEPIEWEVLERDGNKVMLISKYCIEVMQFDSSGASVTWEHCDLRYWLNNGFFYSAFDASEQARITETYVDNQFIPYGSDVSSGNDTADKVFILDCKEAREYGKPSTEDASYATEYVSQIITPYKYDVVSYGENSLALSWWTRTLVENGFPWVVIGGSIGTIDGAVSDNYNGVRPVIWVTLE